MCFPTRKEAIIELIRFQFSFSFSKQFFNEFLTNQNGWRLYELHYKRKWGWPFFLKGLGSLNFVSRLPQKDEIMPEKRGCLNEGDGRGGRGI